MFINDEEFEEKDKKNNKKKKKIIEETYNINDDFYSGYTEESNIDTLVETKKEKKNIFKKLFKKAQKEEINYDENFYDAILENDKEEINLDNDDVINKKTKKKNNINQYDTEYVDSDEENYLEQETNFENSDSFSNNLNYIKIIKYGILGLLMIGGIWLIISFVINKTNNTNSISTNLNNLGIVKGTSYQLNVLANIKNDISFETENNNIISLNKLTGYIEAQKEGTATVNILDKDEIVQTITVYVTNKKIKLTNFNVPSNLTMKKGDKLLLPIVIVPANSTELNFIYQTNDSIISINNGIIIAKEKGNATLTIKNGNLSKNVNITIN